MNNERWNGLERQALWILEHADEVSPVNGNRTRWLRLWLYPAEGRYVSWSVLVPEGNPGEPPLVRQVTWDRPMDRNRMANPIESIKMRHSLAPSIEIKDADLHAEDLETFLRTAAEWKLSPGLPVGSSRENFGIEGFRSIAHLRLAWSGEGPPQGARIIAWAAELRALLAASISERAIFKSAD